MASQLSTRTYKTSLIQNTSSFEEAFHEHVMHLFLQIHAPVPSRPKPAQSAPPAQEEDTCLAITMRNVLAR